MSKSRASATDAQLKFLIIGDSAVGKTSLLLRYIDDAFSPSFLSTIGIDFKKKTIHVDGQSVLLNIWDTAGQERFRTITISYFRGAQGILLCYDATDRKTFMNVSSWISQITEHAEDGLACVLVSTKSDMTDKIVVTEQEAKALADKHGMKYLATSAKMNTNVTEAFETLAKEALKTYSNNTPKVKGDTVKPAANDKGGKAAAGCGC